MNEMGAHMENQHTHTPSSPLSGADKDRQALETSPKPVSRGAQKRVSRACDSCNVRKRRCDNAVPVCTQCLTVGADCTYNRHVRRRGPPKGYSFTHSRKTSTSGSGSARRNARGTRRRRPAWEDSDEEEDEESVESEESDHTEVSSPCAVAELADTDVKPNATGSPASTAVDSLSIFHPTPSPTLGAASPHPTTTTQSCQPTFHPAHHVHQPPFRPHSVPPPHLNIQSQYHPAALPSSTSLIKSFTPLSLHPSLLAQLSATDIAGWDVVYASILAAAAELWDEPSSKGWSLFTSPGRKEELVAWEGVVPKMTTLRHNLAVLSTYLPPAVLSTPWGSVTTISPMWSLHDGYPPTAAPGTNPAFVTIPTVGAAYVAILHCATTAFLHFPPSPRSSTSNPTSHPSPPPPTSAYPSFFTALHSTTHLTSILATILSLAPSSILNFPPHTPALLAHAGRVLLAGQGVPGAGVREHTKAATAVVVKALHVMAGTYPEAGVAAGELLRELESGAGVGSGNVGVKMEGSTSGDTSGLAPGLGLGVGGGFGAAQEYKMEGVGAGGLAPMYPLGMIAGPAPAYSSFGLPLQLGGAGAPVSPLSPTTPVSPFPPSPASTSLLGGSTGLAQVQGHAPFFGTTTGYSAAGQGQYVFFPTSPTGHSFPTYPSAWPTIAHAHAQGVVSPQGWQYAPSTAGLSPRPTMTSVASGYSVMGMTGAFVGSGVPQTLGQLAPHYRPPPMYSPHASSASIHMQKPALQDSPTLAPPPPPPGAVPPSAALAMVAAELGLGLGAGLDIKPSPSLALPAEHPTNTTTTLYGAHPTLSSSDYQAYPNFPMIRPRSGPIPFLTNAANMSDVVVGFGDMGAGGRSGSVGGSLGKTSVEGVFSDSGSGSFAAVLDGDAVPVTDFFLEGEFGME